MAYIKQNWVNGETLATAERMNHIEDGIADLYNAIFPVGQICYSIFNMVHSFGSGD